jgi:Ribbon-helix-helix protein, copG family
MSELDPESRVHIGAFVDPEQRRQLVELARQEDRSVSSVIRQALASYVRREQLEPRARPGERTSLPAEADPPKGAEPMSKIQAPKPIVSPPRPQAPMKPPPATPHRP